MQDLLKQFAVLYPDSELVIDIHGEWVCITITMKWGQVEYIVTDSDDLNCLYISPIICKLVAACYGEMKATQKIDNTFIFNF